MSYGVSIDIRKCKSKEKSSSRSSSSVKNKNRSLNKHAQFKMTRDKGIKEYDLSVLQSGTKKH